MSGSVPHSNVYTDKLAHREIVESLAIIEQFGVKM
jgi:hypothetical protein